MMPLYLRWSSIVLALVIFWPLGLWLLGVRIGRDKLARLKAGQWLVNAGLSFLLFGGLVLLNALVGSEDDPGGRAVSMAISIMLGFVPGLILVWKGRSLRAQGRQIRQYVELLINQESSSLSAISASLNIGPDLVSSQLARLIAEG
jgi:hypothetical protein